MSAQSDRAAALFALANVERELAAILSGAVGSEDPMDAISTARRRVLMQMEMIEGGFHPLQPDEERRDV